MRPARNSSVTPTHPLFVEGSGWVPAGELMPAQLLRRDGGTFELEAVEPAQPNQRVYNIEVGLEHAYRVSQDRIWAHNVCDLAQLTAAHYQLLTLGVPANKLERLHRLIQEGHVSRATVELGDLFGRISRSYPRSMLGVTDEVAEAVMRYRADTRQFLHGQGVKNSWPF